MNEWMTEKELRAWVIGHLSDDWFIEQPEIQIDRDEILVVGRIPQPSLEDGDADDRAIADRSRIESWREETRSARIAIAQQAEAAFDTPISWGARCGDEAKTFTTVSVPAMTRLRMPERKVLDTLIAAGVARSRSDALAWCVKLVAERQEDWLAELRDAISRVHEVRSHGPVGSP